MVPFGGWDMPVEYSGLSNEHTAVRTRAGIYDVSHMGEIEIAGKDALAAVQRISSNDAARLQVGQAQYSGLLTLQGTFVDDLLVYRLAPAHFLLVVNAGNIAKDYAWMAEHIASVGDAVAVDASSRYALIAFQGPEALNVLQPLTGVDLAGMKYYWFGHGEVASVRATVSRTGRHDGRRAASWGDWRLDATTRSVGRAGVARARRALEEAAAAEELSQAS